MSSFNCGSTRQIVTPFKQCCTGKGIAASADEGLPTPGGSRRALQAGETPQLASFCVPTVVGH